MLEFTTDIIRYENGEMNHDEAVEFFQRLIDSGLCWQLQGHYGRTAKGLIDEGMCSEQSRPL